MIRSVALLLLLLVGWIGPCRAFAPSTLRRTLAAKRRRCLYATAVDHGRRESIGTDGGGNGRRGAVQTMGATAVGLAVASLAIATAPARAETETTSMYAPKFVQQYADFTESKEGWSSRQITPGKGGETAAVGDRVVFDWSGYTIGYFGRPFQAKGGPQGGAFDKETEYERTVLGSGRVVKGLECAMVGTSAGQVLQIVVPFERDLSYPADDPNHTRVGPKPTTFSGQRALNFVLENPRIDQTLLFNVKVIRVDKPNAAGGFTRG